MPTQAVGPRKRPVGFLGLPPGCLASALATAGKVSSRVGVAARVSERPGARPALPVFAASPYPLNKTPRSGVCSARLFECGRGRLPNRIRKLKFKHFSHSRL